MIVPATYTGKDIYPFNTFSLRCTAMKPSGIIPALQLSWYHGDMQLDDSLPHITISEEETNEGMEKSSVLNITSARVLSSGSYTCSATVSIPESTAALTNRTATVLITGIIYIILFGRVL